MHDRLMLCLCVLTHLLPLRFLPVRFLPVRLPDVRIAALDRCPDPGLLRSGTVLLHPRHSIPAVGCVPDRIGPLLRDGVGGLRQRLPPFRGELGHYFVPPPGGAVPSDTTLVPWGSFFIPCVRSFCLRDPVFCLAGAEPR